MLPVGVSYPVMGDMTVGNTRQTQTPRPSCSSSPLMRAYMEECPDEALKLVQKAARGYTQEQHKEMLQCLRNSVQVGRELIRWLRWVHPSAEHGACVP